jgi:hypothetical protein
MFSAERIREKKGECKGFFLSDGNLRTARKNGDLIQNDSCSNREFDRSKVHSKCRIILEHQF